VFAATHFCGGLKIICSESLCVLLTPVSQYVGLHMKLKYPSFSINVLFNMQALRVIFLKAPPYY
jgi:hypothetical protein